MSSGIHQDCHKTMGGVGNDSHKIKNEIVALVR